MALEIQQSINQILGSTAVAAGLYGHMKAPERAQNKQIKGLYKERENLIKADAEDEEIF